VKLLFSVVDVLQDSGIPYALIGAVAMAARGVSRAGAVTLEGRPLRVARTVDLVLLKLYAGGPQDAWDIQQLLALETGGAVAAQVERELGQLPAEAADLWRRIRAPLSGS
jgi:hypothetical protein